MSAAAKRAAKRKAKKEADDNHAAVSAVEQVTATMSVVGASQAAAASTHTGERSTVEAAAASAPEPTGPISSDPRVLLKERGNRAFGEKNMADAIRYFTEAIEAPVTEDTDANAAAAAAANATSSAFLPPFLASVHSNRSAAYAACYEWHAAVADADRAITLAPKWSKGYYRRGQALEGQMKYELARSAYAEGMRLDPADSTLVRQMAHISAVITEITKVTAEEAEANPESDIWVDLIDWLVQGKSRFPSLYLKYYSEDYRGVHSHQTIEKDEIVLEVPLSHIMTSEVAKASEIGQKILHSGVDLNSTHTYLSCYLLQERRNPNSFWAPYIACLPVHYRNMPIFFTNEELAYLTGSFSRGKIDDRHLELKEEYDNLVKHVPSFDEFALEEFVWARSVVITRIFGTTSKSSDTRKTMPEACRLLVGADSVLTVIPSLFLFSLLSLSSGLMINGNKTDGLVPMADMLNHKRPRETAWTYDDSRGSFTITALRGMGRGEQIYDSYGQTRNYTGQAVRPHAVGRLTCAMCTWSAADLVLSVRVLQVASATLGSSSTTASRSSRTTTTRR